MWLCTSKCSIIEDRRLSQKLQAGIKKTVSHIGVGNQI